VSAFVLNIPNADLESKIRAAAGYIRDTKHQSLYSLGYSIIQAFVFLWIQWSCVKLEAEFLYFNFPG
jgi:hypothetical protein